MDDGALKADLGRADGGRAAAGGDRAALANHHAAMADHARRDCTGVTRDQMMARHKANHIQVAYAPDADGANLALAAKAATFREMGLDVYICGSVE